MSGPGRRSCSTCRRRPGACSIWGARLVPQAPLRRYAQQLEPGATVIVSLPNVAHWSTYAHLARGSWPRRPEGIFDATHLRWFTLRDARELLRHAGVSPHTVVRRGWIAMRGSRLDVLAPPPLRVPGIRTLITFQFVIAGISD